MAVATHSHWLLSVDRSNDAAFGGTPIESDTATSVGEPMRQLPPSLLVELHGAPMPSSLAVVGLTCRPLVTERRVTTLATGPYQPDAPATYTTRHRSRKAVVGLYDRLALAAHRGLVEGLGTEVSGEFTISQGGYDGCGSSPMIVLQAGFMLGRVIQRLLEGMDDQQAVHEVMAAWVARGAIPGQN